MKYEDWKLRMDLLAARQEPPEDPQPLLPFHPPLEALEAPEVPWDVLLRCLTLEEFCALVDGPNAAS